MKNFAISFGDSLSVIDGYTKNGYQAMAVAGGLLMSGNAVNAVNCGGSDVPEYSKYADYFQDVRSDKLALLNEFSHLGVNWDGYDAAPVNSKAIKNCLFLLNKLSALDALSIDVMPTHHGAILLKYQLISGSLIKCEIGHDLMSYFVRQKGKKTEYRSFVRWNKSGYMELIRFIENLI